MERIEKRKSESIINFVEQILTFTSISKFYIKCYCKKENYLLIVYRKFDYFLKKIWYT
jgi:hypothetical protein